MQTGYIVKGIGGFYYVKTENGIIECRARGKFRKDEITPSVGDIADISLSDDNTGYVVGIHERKNHFVRPPISNVDNFVIVFSLKNPNPDFLFIDKMTVIAKKNGANVILCANKDDLASKEEKKEITDIYKNTGYEIVFTDAKEKNGTDKISALIKNKITVFAGFSGVGKSSLLSCITGCKLETGNISKKLKRGRHTTRCVELIEYNENSYLADTPGFSNLEISGISYKDLEKYFPEFEPYLGDCRFFGCSHNKECDCAILNALKEGKISQSRYESFLTLYEKLKSVKEWEE